MKVCDYMDNKVERQINTIFSKKYTLTEKVLDNVKKYIKDNYGLDVSKITETSSGYIFISNHSYTIGDLTYNPHTGLYNKFNFHVGVIEKEMEAKKKEISETRYKRFKLQRRKTIAKFTAASLATLLALGVIKGLPKNISNENQTAVVETHLNNVESADDLVLIAWANYAIGLISDEAKDSTYDYVHEQREQLYDDFANVMINYYNYVDQVESNLPYEIVGSLIEKYHDDFRISAVSYNDAIEKSMFSSAAFNSTPYADATLLDNNGLVFNKGTKDGEVVDENNNVVLIDPEENKYKVYVQASEITSDNINSNNLPDGAVVYNGGLYVSDSYLNSESLGSPGIK